MLKYFKLTLCVLTIMTWQAQVQAQKAPQKTKLVEKVVRKGDMIRYNLDPKFVTQQSAILQGITKEEVNALSNKYLPVDKMSIVVVGDKVTIKPGLEKLGYDIVELDSDGNPIKM